MYFFNKFVQMKSEGEVRSFPPAHQLQLNNRRKSVVTAATTTDTQTAVSPNSTAWMPEHLPCFEQK